MCRGSPAEGGTAACSPTTSTWEGSRGCLGSQKSSQVGLGRAVKTRDEVSHSSRTSLRHYGVKTHLFLVGEVQEADYLCLPHVSSEKCQVAGEEGDPVHLVSVPAAREKPREAREDTSSSGGSELTSWPLIPPARGIWVSGEAQLRATSLPPLSLEIRC